MKRSVILLAIVLSLIFSIDARSIFAGQAAASKYDTPALSGKVIKTMDSGRYTYVCLEKDGKKIWVATYKMKVVVGQNMSFKPGIEMVNFESKTLKRKFDKIYFTVGPIKDKK